MRIKIRQIRLCLNLFCLTGSFEAPTGRRGCDRPWDPSDGDRRALQLSSIGPHFGPSYRDATVEGTFER